MRLDDWDKVVAPLLGAISIRADSVAADIRQIKEWTEQLPAVPGFQTEAKDKIDKMLRDLEVIVATLEITKRAYENKETVS